MYVRTIKWKLKNVLEKKHVRLEIMYLLCRCYIQSLNHADSIFRYDDVCTYCLLNPDFFPTFLRT